MPKGLIKIIGLKVSSYVGVPDKEREQRQDLLINVTIKPSNSLHGLNDKIEDTVDYFLGKKDNPCTADEGLSVMEIMDTFTKKA